jgi:FG-GAP-like repeat
MPSMRAPDNAPSQIDQAQPPPDVTIEPGKASISIGVGGQAQATFTVDVGGASLLADSAGSSGDLSLVSDSAEVRLGQLPQGISGQLSTSSLTGNQEVTLTLNAAQDAMPTVATFEVTAIAGPRLASSLVTLDVTATGQLYPKYHLLTVLYAPPGTNGGNSKSQVLYATGSTTGTTTSMTSSFKDGVVVTASFVDLGGSAQFTESQTTDNTVSINKTTSTTSSITVPGPAQDGINHGDDLFVLWLNPVLNVTIDDHVTWELAVNGQEMVTLQVYASWLQDPSNMPPGVAQQLADAGLTTADYAQILSCNPFTSENPAIDPNRFVLLGSVPYEPPASSGDTPVIQNYNQSNATTSTDTTQTQVQYEATLKEGVSGILEEWLKFNASGSLTWTNISAFTQTTGSSQSAGFTIGGPAFGYASDDTELFFYWDTVFSSFMFSFDGGPQNGGLAWQPLGEIAAGTGAPGSEVLFADLTGDGKADYLVVNPDGSVQAWLNGGQNAAAPHGWGWNPAGTIAADVGAPGSQIQFADLTGDGLSDYLNVNPDGSVQAWLNGGSQ